MICPYCGSYDTTYIGIEDGAGDYGTAVSETYACDECDQYFEADRPLGWPTDAPFWEYVKGVRSNDKGQSDD